MASAGLQKWVRCEHMRMLDARADDVCNWLSAHALDLEVVAVQVREHLGVAISAATVKAWHGAENENSSGASCGFFSFDALVYNGWA